MKYTNPFASILYDTHLLGDYTTTRIEPLLNLNAVIDDIETALYQNHTTFKVVESDHFKMQAGLPNSLCIFKVILLDIDNLYIFANSCYICEKK